MRLAADGLWIAEATGLVDLGNWPAGTRLILRRERPHPGAQLRITDVDGKEYLDFFAGAAPAAFFAGLFFAAFFGGSGFRSRSRSSGVRGRSGGGVGGLALARARTFAEVLQTPPAAQIEVRRVVGDHFVGSVSALPFVTRWVAARFTTR